MTISFVKCFAKQSYESTNGNHGQPDQGFIRSATLFFLQIEQHDDKQEQHNHRAGVNEYLHGGKKEGIEQDK